MSAKIDQARYDAFEKLVQMNESAQYISHNDEKNQHQSHPRAIHIVAGVTRWQSWLDFIIDSFAKGDPSNIQSELRIVLRIAIFELLILKDAPYAVINDAVNLAKKKVMANAGGFVNGVLRAIDRKRDALPEPNGANKLENLAITKSHPLWLLERWAKNYDEEELNKLLDANNSIPRFFVRVNRVKTSPKALASSFDMVGIEYKQVEEDSDLFEVVRLKPVLNFVKNGQCFVQDKGAGLAVKILDPEPEESILDVCAAPGGKSMQIAGLMQNRGRIVAADLTRRRLDLVKQNAKNYSVSILETFEGDMTKIKMNEVGRYDGVLLDAPCSGTGVLSKRADLRWNRKPSDMKDLFDLQLGLLRASLDLVQPGGRLVYSTCSIEVEENEQIVEKVAKEFPHFNLDPEYVRTLPHEDGCDGAFACRFDHS